MAGEAGRCGRFSGSQPDTGNESRELYASRMRDYESADRVIEATSRSDGRVVDEIVDWLRKQKLDEAPRIGIMAEALRNDDLGYPIVVGKNLPFTKSRGLRASARSRARCCSAMRTSHVLAFGQEVAKALGNPPVLAFRLGETQKRLNTVEHVLDANGLPRGSSARALVVGVGGGVASDLFGFACATYMRGIAYGHVATSLVAMVDAAIGGKTGVNLRAGKESCRAAFEIRSRSSATSQLLARSLGARFAQGLAEIVKAGVIEGGDFFEALEELAPHPLARWPWEHVIESAIKVKTMTVADDRHEAGIRELLNLGHTFAHAFERASEYRMTHGEAVSVGLRAAGLLALRTGRFTEAEHLRVITLLTLLRLPLQTSLAPEAVLAAMSGDKKKRSGRLRFVRLPRSIGDVEYGVECLANGSDPRRPLPRSRNRRRSFVRVVDALPAIRSSRFDLPLTYDADGLELGIGDVVRVPLGSRELRSVRRLARTPDPPSRPNHSNPRTRAARRATLRAFDEIGLQLASFVAEHYLCTLGEALGAAVLSRRDPSNARFLRSRSPTELAPLSVAAAATDSFDLGRACRRLRLEQLLRHPGSTPNWRPRDAPRARAGARSAPAR